MLRKILCVLVALIAVFILFADKKIFADEGMWLLNNLPLKQLKDRYGFVPTPEWVEHIQKASARLPNCSASFVSPNGLLKTNWHCAEEAVKALSTPENNYYENGFYAKTLSEELKTNLKDVRVLLSMKDVTQRINDAVSNNLGGNPAKARQDEVASIQRNKVGLSTADILNIDPNLLNEDPFVCEVVTLYQGGQYHNYCYRVYNDIRLVFALERNIGFFGGDADNFEYPRYTLDVAFLRAYENGKPAKTPFHFKLPKSGPKEDDLLFVSGHPGRTARLLTDSALATERDVRVPFLLDLFRRRELTTTQFMIRGKKNYQTAESDLFSWQNARKLYVGKIRGLQDGKLMLNNLASAGEIAAHYNDPSLVEQYIEGMRLVQEAQLVIQEIYPEYMLLVRGLGFDSRLYDYASSLVSGNRNMAKAVLEERQGQAPLDLEYEETKLRDSLTHLVEVLGVNSWTVSVIKNNWCDSPTECAHKFVHETVLSDSRQWVHAILIGSNPQQLRQVHDPLINFAEFIKSESKGYHQLWNEAAEKEKQGYAKINDALFKLYGTNRYPDATFTLRLAFGTVKGYEEGGKVVPARTTIGDAYKHALEFGNSGDHKLPARWWKRKKFVNLKTPLNFVSDVDITGGNSGSPVFNRDLEIVGIIFDSNIHGLVSDYDYNYSPQARAIAVHSAGIIEILDKIYQADRLVKELIGK